MYVQFTYGDSMNTALLIARLAIGLGFAAHGAQKLFGWFGGYGLKTTGEFMIKLGWQRGRFFGTAASLAETTAGVLIALGFLWPVGPALLIRMMLTAALTVHVKKGLFNDKGGYELNLIYAMSALVLTFTGPGDYSLDRFLGLKWFYSSRNDWIAVGVAVVIALANVVLARRPAPPAASA
jgi:putative oxidoreductase